MVFLFKNFDCNDVSLGSVVVRDCGYRPPQVRIENVSTFFGQKSFLIGSDLCVRTFLSFLLIISSFLPPHFGFLNFGFSNFFLKVIVNSYFVLTLQFLIRMPGNVR